jgi:exopolysaccharide biosynthesis WecB/TagA/CpsF family protein
MFISGVRFSNVSMRDAINRIMMFAQSRKPKYVCTANLDHLRLANSNSSFYDACWDADMVVADGKPVVWLSTLQGSPLKERVAGVDLFLETCQTALKAGFKICLLGGKPGSADRTRDVLLQQISPFCEIHTICPTPEEVENPENLIKEINQVRPNILFVAFGAPKQEIWIHKHLKKLNVPVSIGVGGTFEIVAGVTKRAPRFMQTLGAEWLWRLMQERRLFKRYILQDVPFLFQALAKAWYVRFHK